MKFILVLTSLLSFNLSFANSPFEMCLDTARYWASYGNNINAYSWCSDVNTYPVAVCREAGVQYKLFYGHMNVKKWCSDVTSMREARCRKKALISKGETGHPSNVKSYCN